MKIGINAPVWVRVPPERYGGIELVVALLANELVRQGHEVDLYATGNSITEANLHSVYKQPQTPILHSMPDSLHSSRIFLEANEYDIIHDHTGFMGVACAALAGDAIPPVLSTLHGNFNKDSKFYYSHFKDDVFFNPISEYQKSRYPDLNYVDTVYNAIDIDRYELRANKEDFFLFVSRICEDKAPHLAIEAVKAMGEKLVMAGKVDPGDDAEYFRSMIQPHVDGDQIQFLGEVDELEKLRLFGAAKAFLFPIQWEEPFGLVMAESIACGTPVVAWRNGAAPEVVDDQKTGFIVDSMDEFIKAAQKIDQIDPMVCRSVAENRFSPTKMAEAYVDRYSEIIDISQSQ